MCGIVGVISKEPVNQLIYDALLLLQHRGQESAGIAVSDGRQATLYKQMGLVSQVFNEDNLRPLQGHIAIGHTRYSTADSSRIVSAQPFLLESALGPVALAHNGNLVNSAELRKELFARGVGLTSACDSEAMVQLLAGAHGDTWLERIRHLMQQTLGAYSLTILTRDALYAVRDPWGFRPLAMGRLNGGWVVASESCALQTIGAQGIEEIPPGKIVIVDDEGARIFAEHTANNVGRFLAIALDKTIISCPRIEGAIPEGRGQITGNFSVDEAKATVLQLRYGALPIPLKVIDTRAVGPTLGQESVQRSVQAGTIGLIVVLLFMLIYYRLPGLLADVALLIYAALTLALFKLIPVTLTLPGIAGFLLSVGMAVDANILIFERMREELRQGRTLGRAVESGFRRAWTSILDSNVSTWITCGILWAFGNSFGASMVKGFALNLALGVLVSMFTAMVVTRTFMRTTVAVAGDDLRDRKWLMGV